MVHHGKIQNPITNKFSHIIHIPPVRVYKVESSALATKQKQNISQKAEEGVGIKRDQDHSFKILSRHD